MKSEKINLNRINLNKCSKEILIQMIERMSEEQEKLNKSVSSLEEQLNVLRREKFGRKTEKNEQPDHQYTLVFNEAEVLIVDPTLEQSEPCAKDMVPALVEEKPTKKSHPKKKASESTLKNLKANDVYHELEGKALECECGGTFKAIGEDSYDELIFHASYFELRKHHVKSYSCDKCHSIKRANHPPVLFPKSMASPSLISGIMTGKYVNALPFNRIEKAVNDADVFINRQTMARWMIKASDLYFSLIYDRMKEELLKLNVIHADETTVEVSKDGRSAGSKSYMWVYTGAEKDPKIVIFEYQKTRSAKHPKEFLKNYKGYLCCDGYQAYHSLSDDIIIAGCWSHSRRHFSNAEKVLKNQENRKQEFGISREALNRIGEFFKMDKQWKNLSYEEHLEKRQKELKPKVLDYFEWIKSKQNKVSLKTETGKGISYSINQEKYLLAFLENPNVPLDNSEAERKIRNFVIGRKNFVLVDTIKGAESSAIMYSIAETVKANNLKCREYFEYVLTELPKHMDDNSKNMGFIDDLLPWSDKLPDELKKTK